MLNVDSWGDLDTPQGFAVDLPAVDCDGAEPAMLIDVPWPGFHAPGVEALSGSLDSPSTGETLRTQVAAAAASACAVGAAPGPCSFASHCRLSSLLKWRQVALITCPGVAPGQVPAMAAACYLTSWRPQTPGLACKRSRA